MPKGNMNRIAYLDRAKGVSITAVVLLHLFGSLRGMDDKPFLQPMISFFIAFSVTSFFIISGMTLYISGEEKKPFREIVAKKVRTLLVPYFAFSLMDLVYEIGTCLLDPAKWQQHDVVQIFIYTFTMRGMSVLWFLSSLFLGELMLLFLLKKIKNVYEVHCIVWVFACLSIGVAPLFQKEIWSSSYLYMTICFVLLSIARAMLAAFFILIGREMGKGELKNRKRNGDLPFAFIFDNPPVEFAAGILLMMVCGIYTMTGFAGEIDFNRMIFSDIPGFLLVTITGGIGLLLICRASGRIAFLEWIGKQSMVIMVTHLGFNILGNALALAYALNRYVTRGKVYVLYFSIFVFVLLFQYAAIWVVNTFCKSMLGRFQK